jgi:hypothetical protein
MKIQTKIPLFLALLLAGAVTAAPLQAGSLPRFESSGEDPLSASDSAALVRWVLDQPEVAARFEGGRVRVLASGAGVIKDDQGREIRRGVVHVRNYKLGLVHSIAVDLLTGALEITDDKGAIQPNADEIADAVNLVHADAELGALIDSHPLHIDGGFYERSPVAEDPCARDVCLLIELMNPGHGNGFARRVVVNLSRRDIANRNFQGPRNAGEIVPLADLGGPKP